MDERIWHEPAKRTGFSAPGDKPKKFAQSGARLGVSGSRQEHRRRPRRGFPRSFQIVGKHYRLCGGEIRTPGAPRFHEGRIRPTIGPIFPPKTIITAGENPLATYSAPLSLLLLKSRLSPFSQNLSPNDWLRGPQRAMCVSAHEEEGHTCKKRQFPTRRRRSRLDWHRSNRLRPRN